MLYCGQEDLDDLDRNKAETAFILDDLTKQNVKERPGDCIKRWKLFLPLLLLTVLLCACGTSTPSEDTKTAPPQSTQGEVETFALPGENVPTVSATADRAPNHSGPGFYYAGQAISYAASITDTPFILCSQSGCTHSDNSCDAYIGDAREFAEYQGQWYAMVKDADNEYTLLNMDPTTRERRALGHWKETGQGTTRAYLYLLSHGYAYVTIRRETYDPQTFTYQQQPDEKIRIALATGDSQVLTVAGSITAASENHVFSVERINDDDNYGPEPTYAILREYNLTNGTCRVISDTADGFRTTPDPNTTYGDLLIWQRGDTLLVTDVSTLEQREVLTMPNIVNYWVMDNRAFFITHDDAGICKVYHQLLTGGDPIQLYNEGQTDGMVYGIIEEGNDYFAGPYHEKMNHPCSKQDFYAERYDT